MASFAPIFVILVFRFSKQGGPLIKFNYVVVQRNLCESVTYALKSVICISYSRLMTEYGHYHSWTKMLSTTFVGATFSLWLDRSL